MDKQSKLSIRLELLWWLFTALIVFGVLFPILSEIENYPFLFPNIIFIIVLITFARYFFFLKHTFLAKKQRMKVVLFFLCIPLGFYLMNEVYSFQTQLDDGSVQGLVDGMPYKERINLYNYISGEMLFFGIGSLAVAILFPLRLMLSVWRLRNRGTI